jgi:hypothetical protein
MRPPEQNRVYRRAQHGVKPRPDLSFVKKTNPAGATKPARRIIVAIAAPLKTARDISRT